MPDRALDDRRDAGPTGKRLNANRAAVSAAASRLRVSSKAAEVLSLFIGSLVRRWGGLKEGGLIFSSRAVVIARFTAVNPARGCRARNPDRGAAA